MVISPIAASSIFGHTQAFFQGTSPLLEIDRQMANKLSSQRQSKSLSTRTVNSSKSSLQTDRLKIQKYSEASIPKTSTLNFDSKGLLSATSDKVLSFQKNIQAISSNSKSIISFQRDSKPLSGNSENIISYQKESTPLSKSTDDEIKVPVKKEIKASSNSSDEIISFQKDFKPLTSNSNQIMQLQKKDKTPIYKL